MKFCLLFSPFLVCLLLAACSTPPRDTARASQPASAAPAPANRNLRRGMTETEIRALWGEPLAIHAGKAENERIFVYTFDVLTTQRMVAATVNLVDAVDPIDGGVRTVTDPVLSPQKVTVTQTIVLQLLDGKLASWARRLGEQRSFN